MSARAPPRSRTSPSAEHFVCDRRCRHFVNVEPDGQHSTQELGLQLSFPVRTSWPRDPPPTRTSKLPGTASPTGKRSFRCKCDVAELSDLRREATASLPSWPASATSAD